MAATNNSWIFKQFFIAYVLTALCHPSVLGYSDKHERVKYHLDELSNGLKEIKTIPLQKRSVTAMADHDAVIYKSLVSFCSTLTAKGIPRPTPDPQTTTVASTDSEQKEHLRTISLPPPRTVDIPSTTTIASWPRLFPTRVQAERDGKKVWLVFEIIHTTPGYIMTSHSFDDQKIKFDYPESALTPVISTVRMAVDDFNCDNENSTYADETVTIGMSLQERPFHVSVTVDVCRFDQVYEDNIQRWKTKPGVRSQKVPLPYFKVLPDLPDELVIQKGHNVTFNLDVRLVEARFTSIYVRLWDKRKGKFLRSGISLRMSEDDIAIENEQREREGILSIEIVEKFIVNRTWENGAERGESNNKKAIKAKVKVIVNTANGKRSGKVLISTSWRRHGYYNRTVLDYLNAMHGIYLKLPGRPNVFPKNTVDITTEGMFQCDNNGMRRYPRHGKNCTVFCYAEGTDMQSIFIAKTNPYRRSVNSVSYVLGDTAFAMLDMGPSKEALDGKYRCTVVMSNGKTKKKDLKLYTPPFTTVNNASVEYLGNDKVLVKCSASGRLPLNMTVEAGKNGREYERIDDKYSNDHKVITVGNNTKTLSLSVPTSQLRPPVTRLLCRAIGERGEDQVGVYDLDQYLPSHLPRIPQIDRMPNASFVVRHEANHTVEITCSAIGRDPLLVRIYQGVRDPKHRIDDDPLYRSATRTISSGGKRVSVYMPSEAVSLPYAFLCRATNNYGEDTYFY